MLAPKYSGRGVRTLDFDIENRPITYAGRDFTFSDITAIACRFNGEEKMYVWALEACYTAEEFAAQKRKMLDGFAQAWEICDMATGHYCRAHDLALLNGEMVEFGLKPLHGRPVSDTYSDLKKFRGVSKSQEALAEMFGLDAPKVQMSQWKWRLANRLLPEGVAYTIERVTGDVIQHEQLRAYLLEHDLLKPPKAWRP